MLGAPGAGKGTQAQILQERFGAAQISTGDVLRRHRVEHTQLGELAQSYMDKGELVPDKLIIDMVAEELANKHDFILDGFPRTIPQAEELDGLLKKLGLPLDCVVCFDVERAVLISRLSARWTNPRNGNIYNTLTKPPRVAGVDDEDGGPLVQRPDDQPATVANRLDVYDRQTAPLIAYYTDRGLLQHVDGLGAIDDVTAAIVSGCRAAFAGEMST